jgi:hypothetical protein
LRKPITGRPVPLVISASEYNNLVRVASLISPEPYSTSLLAPSFVWFRSLLRQATNDSRQICAILSRLHCISRQCKKVVRYVLHSPTNNNVGREFVLTRFHQPSGALPSTKTFLNPSRKLVSPLDGDRQFSLYDNTADDEPGTASRSSYAGDYTRSYLSSLQT